MTSAATVDPLLRVRGLEVVFPGSRRVLHAVNGVSFDLARGETLGLVGESGCGKSTIGRALLGLVPEPGQVVAGSIEVDGEDVTAAPPSRRRELRGAKLAMVFQDPMSALNPVMTVGAQLREALGVHTDLRGRKADDRAAELLALVGIPAPRDRLRAYPHQLSGGMRQRVGIAMAISCEPAVLVADEPTTALDVTVQAQVLDLLRRLSDGLGMAVVLVSHDLGVVAGLADRVVVLYGGYVVEEGTAEDVLTAPVHPYTAALIGSRAEIDGPRPDRLRAIPGSAPALAGPALECPFRPRCAYAEPACRQGNPVLETVRPGHRAACPVRARALAGAAGGAA
ncbi:ABC transporter ATP-binding protein [Amycolatopsis jejuensis]|uniref:ABC transporter ATP-binding protein n=1 Tax=Amycolatopsis jejuensis TaxID=330084 RepID=UPI000AC938C8|nr:ABC transporter ATP-binding protein [Amycolatopsis jejuensis]